jgi:integrase
MGAIDKRGRGRFRARYWGPDGNQRSRTFPTEKAAKDWLALHTVDIRRGDWSDPKLAQITVGMWAETWLQRKAVKVKPSTLASYQSLLKTCVLPEWGQVPLGSVMHGDVAAWIARLSQRLGASRVRKAHIVLSQMLDSAVRDGRLTKNPALSVDLPRLPHREHRYLTHQQVRSLADAAAEYRPLILTLAYCGLRFGEAAAIRVRSVDLLRGRIRVSQSVSEINGQMVWGTPKSHAARTVPVPKFLREVLAEQMTGRTAEDLVFASPDGTALRSGNFRRRAWNPATASAGLTGLTPHDLRHTAASLAIEAGANVKAVQTMLGHSSAAMTLDVYADLFDSSLDAVADRLDEAYTASAVSSMWPDVPSNVLQMPAQGE